MEADSYGSERLKQSSMNEAMLEISDEDLEREVAAYFSADRKLWIEREEYVHPQKVLLSPTSSDKRSMSRNYLGASYLFFADNTEGQPYVQVLHDIKMSNLQKTRDEIAEVVSRPDLRPLFERRQYVLPEVLKSNILTSNIHGAENGMWFEMLPHTDDETLALFLQWNRDHITKASEAMMPKLEQFKQEFTTRVEDAIRRQHLPLSLAQLKSRMSDVAIRVVDPFLMVPENIAGCYSTGYRCVNLTESDHDTLLRETLYHELVHHLSGQTIVKRGSQEGWDSPDNLLAPQIYTDRVGLACCDGRDASRWLNEALTEQLAQLLLLPEAKDIDFSKVTKKQFMSAVGGTYRNNRYGMARLFSVPGANITSALAAYFEDYVPERKEPLPKTKQFWRNLSKVWGKDIEQTLTAEEGEVDLRRDQIERIIKKMSQGRLFHMIFNKHR